MALDLAEARQRARAKFPEPIAQTLIADPQGVQMATPLDVARHKALRFSSGETSIDLCCGIGADLMAMGDTCEGIDIDPLRAWMASQNARRPTRSASAEDADVSGRLVHIDPSRRDGEGRRTRGLPEMQPDAETVFKIVSRSSGAGVKLAPSVEPHELPEGELEVISRAGRLNQAVLWSGTLRGPHPARATIVEPDTTHTITARPDKNEFDAVGEPARYVYTLDPAIERAGLIREISTPLGLDTLWPSLGMLTGADRVESPWLSGFELMAQMPWRTPKVREWLRAHEAGIVEVKTRGGAVNPDRAQRELRGDGSIIYTVFVLRFGTPIRALITRRLEPISSATSS